MSGIGYAITSTTYAWTSLVVHDRSGGKDIRRDDIERIMHRYFDRQLTYSERSGWSREWRFAQIDEVIRGRCHEALNDAFPAIDVCWYGKQVEVAIKAAACIGGFIQ